MTTINIIFRSEYYGAGKTHTCISFRRPNDEKAPRRLLFDGEYRDASFQSPDDEDHPALSQFAFTRWQDEFGEMPSSLMKVANNIQNDVLDFDVIIFDNATLFQDELMEAMQDKQMATKICQALGCYPRFASFLQYRFNPNDAASFYSVVKGVIRAFLLMCRKKNIDVLVTAESKNVWKNYGSRDKANPPTIQGQTAKLWDPWFQMSDLLLVLERLSGSRLDGTAKLIPWPKATLDTFNPKCSIPGIAAEFYFKNWDIFWAMADRRIAPTEEEYGRVNIEIAQEAEDTGMSTINEAKSRVVEYAIERGFIKDKLPASITKLMEAAAEAGLEKDNVLAEYPSWVEMIHDNI